MRLKTSQCPVALTVLLGTLSTVSGLPGISVDPVIDEDGQDIVQSNNVLDTTLSDNGAASFRKAIVHEKTLTDTHMKDSNVSAIARRQHRGPEEDYDTYISLINATPYRWHKTYNASYQLAGWEYRWPTYIIPGQSVSVRAENFGYGLYIQSDAAGEVTYALEGTFEPASFQVQYRSGHPHNVWIEYRDKLHTLNSAQNTSHNLGFSRVPGGVGFVLAGKEGDFLSNDGPIEWMQSQLHEIGHLPLREITLPRSHHAGMWKCGESIGLATARNTQTHRVNLYNQLGNGGIRVLDVRPVFRHKKFRESHGTFLGKTYNGMMGASIEEMVNTFNEFTKKYHGELYIWDIHEGDARNGDKGFSPVSDDDLKELYRELRNINWRGSFSDDEDLTTKPLNFFMSRKLFRERESTVVIRVPTSWANRKHFPGGRRGFVSGINFPLKTHWSETNRVSTMVTDQVASLREARSSRSNEMYNMDWLLTQMGIQVAFPLDSIIELSRAAWASLYGGFWNGLTDTVYPNMVTLDDIHGNSHKAIVMAVNKCFAARRCGDLGGKVKGLNGTKGA